MKTLVLGNGIVGLWTADILSRGGHEVVVAARSHFNATTSAAAMCVLNPTFPGDPTSTEFRRNVRWARETLEYMSSSDLTGPLLEDIWIYEFGNGRELEADFPMSNLDYLDFVDFSVLEVDGAVALCQFAVRFKSFLCDTQEFLPLLVQRLVDRGVVFRRQDLSSVSELRGDDAEMIFNCLGYQTIFADPELYPVFGQAMRVSAPYQDGLAFGIGWGDHAVYTHKNGFYIGSYFLPGAGDSPREELYRSSFSFVNEEFSDLCRCVGIDPPVIDLQSVQCVQTGVRPFRKSGVLLELDKLGSKPVVHNYGHGAHGWTVGYASALEAVTLSGLL